MFTRFFARFKKNVSTQQTYTLHLTLFTSLDLNIIWRVYDLWAMRNGGIHYAAQYKHGVQHVYFDVKDTKLRQDLVSWLYAHTPFSTIDMLERGLFSLHS